MNNVDGLRLISYWTRLQFAFAAVLSDNCFLLSQCQPIIADILATGVGMEAATHELHGGACPKFNRSQNVLQWFGHSKSAAPL